VKEIIADDHKTYYVVTFAHCTFM